MKSGTVAIVGRPNVGKSTLLNALLKEKVAIVSDKPQTTRTRILGVLHRPDAQIAYLDTPGLHQPCHQLNRRMLRTVMEAIREADVLYVMIEGTAEVLKPGDEATIRQVHEVVPRGRAAFLLLNKVDLVNKARLLPLIDSARRLMDWREVVPISAKTGTNLDRLVDLTVAVLPEGKALFGEDVVTDQTMRTLASEIIREKILERTREEIPYSVAVEIDRFVEGKRLARITASILVERDSQKGIIIGKHGEQLKAIGTAARLEMERLFELKVFLELWVKVRAAWREDEQLLTALGY